MSTAVSTIEDLTPEVKEEIKDQIKKIEDNILAKIEKYNEEIKFAETEEGKLRILQSKAYLASERYRKSKRTNEADLSLLEVQLNELDSGEIQIGQTLKVPAPESQKSKQKNQAASKQNQKNVVEKSGQNKSSVKKSSNKKSKKR